MNRIDVVVNNEGDLIPLHQITKIRDKIEEDQGLFWLEVKVGYSESFTWEWIGGFKTPLESQAWLSVHFPRVWA